MATAHSAAHLVAQERMLLLLARQCSIDLILVTDAGQC